MRDGVLERVAIVGMGAVLPGSGDIGEFWGHVLAGRSVAKEVPAGRWPVGVEEVLERGGVAADRVYGSRGCFVEGLGMAAEVVAGLDPMFHFLLKAGREAWGDAVTGRVDPRRAGIIVGNIALPTDGASAWSEGILGAKFEERVLRGGRGMLSGISSRGQRGEGLPAPLSMAHEVQPKGCTPNALNRYVAGLPAAVLARALGIGGCAFTLDAACASSLYAVKLAAEELLAGRADVMVTGGLSRPDCLYTQMGFSQLRALSKSGVCSPFDAKADGLVVGEGACVFVLKRVADALRDGDRIYATIAGVGLSNDIGGNLMLPDSGGQLRAMRAAYAQAGWKPEEVGLIECHGTGTPIGDGVEFGSLTKLWGAARRGEKCVIGSVKSNVGHLLTAAGGAGLIKTLLAMRDRKLPPTANFAGAAKGIVLEGSAFEILREGREWKSEGARKAGVSAFGFGGINAHVLVEEWRDESNADMLSGHSDRGQQGESLIAPLSMAHGEQPAGCTPNGEIAIVGMGAAFGPWGSLEAFGRRVFGAQAEATKPEGWWGVDGGEERGFFVGEVKVPVGRFRIPPAELGEMLPQQLLMLQVAADAFGDAGMGEIGGERLDTGVFIGIGLDLNTTNFRMRWMMEGKARKWAREMGVELTEGEMGKWVEELKEAAGPALTANRTMGALGGIVASRVARAFGVGGPSFTVSSEETSGLSALEVAVRALQRGEINVALAGAVDLAGDVRAVLGERACGRGGALIGEGAGAVVLKRLEDAVRDGDRIYAVIGGDDVNTKALSHEETRRGKDATKDERRKKKDENGAELWIGSAGAAMGMAEVVKGALRLHYRLDARGGHWLADRAEGAREIVVEGESVGGTVVRVVMREGAGALEGGAVVERGCEMFVVAGADEMAMLGGLGALELMSGAGNLEGVARKWFAGARGEGARRIAIVARSVGELRGLIERARRAVRKGEKVADGVFYSPAAVKGKVGLVFPGAGNAFVGMGREVAVQFPGVMRRLEAENRKLKGQFAGGKFWEVEGAVMSHREEIFGQVWLGAMMGDVLGACGVKPEAVIGYSLGETTGLFATRAWTGRDEMLARMNASALFESELAGECAAVRRAWKLQAGEKVDWVVGVVERGAEALRAAVAERERVYLLIVNTPGECVVGGDRAAVGKLVRDLGCVWHGVEGVTTVHCEVARSVEGAYRELHLLETCAPEGVRFYSGAAGAAYEVTRESAAESIVRQAMGPFDFTKVIESAYADGVRIFVEAGPGASCSRVIGKILEGREHVARSACVAGQEGMWTLLSLLGQLVAEGVEVDLGVLYGGEVKEMEVGGKRVVVRTGGEGFGIPEPPARGRAEVLNTETQTYVQRASEVMNIEKGDEVMVADGVGELMEQVVATEGARARVQERFLRMSQEAVEGMGRVMAMQMELLEGSPGEAGVLSGIASFGQQGEGLAAPLSMTHGQPGGWTPNSPGLPPRSYGGTPNTLDREMCMEFAVGEIGRVLGEGFAHVDLHPTRVRLPDEPLMLVDRIVEIEGVPQSMTRGRVVTEHDVLEGAWYLDGRRIPTCIAVEAGQADLFLSGYLGIDSITRGLAVYRLLDAVVTFQGELPRPGETIRYDIAIEHFFRQGQTYLFRFRFDATVEWRPVLTMRNGCAGFFTQAELAAGQGIVLTSIDKRAVAGKVTGGWRELVAMGAESYDDGQVARLRAGDLAGCFGETFGGLKLERAEGLPSGRMTLVHRVLKLDPAAGRFGLGQITGEADISADDWFMVCHFVDDRVMPGTLMYECCLHTLRIYLLRMGWVAEAGSVVYEPVVGVSSQLKCRGQVLVTTKKVQYEVTLKEVGYQADGTPYVIADALMYGDGKAIVQMGNMSVRLTGATREGLEALWEKARRHGGMEAGMERNAQYGTGLRTAQTRVARNADGGIGTTIGTVLFDTDRITAFALGKPSEAFGERYKMFDPGAERKIARLPGPPFQFLDRIVSIERCEPWKLAAGGVIEAEYDVPRDAWYFGSNRQREMPFAVLLEAALQPCGWLAAYVGSALASDVDMRFRNLGGSAVQSRAVTLETGRLTTRVKMTSVSNSGGMLIQHFDMAVRCGAGEVYKGSTYFGFFSHGALANQIGIQKAVVYEPTAAEAARSERFEYPAGAPYPDATMRMVDRVDLFVPDGGPKGLGFIRGMTVVNPAAWFFKAHFFEDPVWPGSLGLESFVQLLKVAAIRRWGGGAGAQFETMAAREKHSWVYRGQIIPADKQVRVQAVVTKVDEARRMLGADGFLTIDGRVIYQMTSFAIRMTDDLNTKPRRI